MSIPTQGDASCVPNAIRLLERAVAQQRPDLSAWVTRTKTAYLGSGGFATAADHVVALDEIVRGLQRAGAGGVVKSALSMRSCPTAYMTAVRLGTIAPG